jgi:hypothetical protein
VERDTEIRVHINRDGISIQTADQIYLYVIWIVTLLDIAVESVASCAIVSSDRINCYQKRKQIRSRLFVSKNRCALKYKPLFLQT